MVNQKFGIGIVSYVFIFGMINQLHGVKLNSVHPREFLSFLSKLKDKRKSIDDHYSFR